jgi:DNA polymerase (family 10)
VISTDSHAANQLTFMKYGVTTARRGWIEKKDVINTLPLEEFLAALRPKPQTAKGHAKRKSA